MTSRRIRLLLTPEWWVSAAPLLLFLLPLLRGRAIFWGLPTLQFIPWRHYAWTLLRKGVFPLWNPLNGLGAPLMANYQLALFYPPAWPLFLMDELWGPAGLAWGFTLLLPLHLAWGAVGVVRLLRGLGVRQRGQIVAGLAFGMGGYLVARSSFYSMIWAVVWLPWILTAIDGLLICKTKVEGLQVGLKLALYLAMMLLAGHAQVAWYALLFAGFWAVVRGWQLGGWKLSLRSSSILVGCGIFAGMLTAIQLMPTFEYLLHSQRASAYDLETAMVYSFSPLRLLGFLIPDLFGNPGYGDFYGYATYWEDAVYIGLIPFILALTTLPWLFRKKGQGDGLHNLAGFLWVITISGILLALGANTPIFPWLFHHIPTFEMFQAPARWMIWPTFALALLAGLAADRWTQPGKKGRVAFNLITFGGLILAASTALVSLALSQVEPGMVRGLILFGLASAISAFIARRLPTAGWLSGRGYVAGAWILVDLLIAQAVVSPTVPVKIFNTAHSQIEQINKTLKRARAWIDPEVQYEMVYNRLFDFADFRPGKDWSGLRDVLVPNLNLLDEIPMINNFDPLVPARFATWLDQMEGEQPTLVYQWLALMNAGAEVVADPAGTQRTGLKPLEADPRFTWSACATWAGPTDDSFEMVNKRFAADAASNCVVLEGNNLTDTAGTSMGQGSLAVQTDSPNRIALTLDSSSAGWVVVRDTWYPGWEAAVDGVPSPVLRADYLFKAVSVPAGSHHVELEYKPDSFTSGLWVSLVSWVFMGLAWLALRQKSK
ncbi:MAG: YfhO family protein [Bellilinea sp.]